MPDFGSIICLIMAVGISWNILTFIKQVSALGTTCYYMGEAINNCIHPGFYFGAWIIALAFLIGGVMGLVTKRS